MQDTPSYDACEPATAVAASLILEVPERLISIHLAYSVIERLERDVIAAFNALPKRGAEVGGLLLGRVDESGNRTVYIDDFAPVACEYRRGPSYLLSDSDRAGLESAITRAGTAVLGFYRSHTRQDFGFDEEDVSSFQTYFPNSNRVFLLIKPLSISQSVARFSLWEGGEMGGDLSLPEFPFGRRWIPEHVTQAPAKTVTADAAPSEAAVPQEPDRPRRRRTWIPLAACLTAAVTGIVGFQTWVAVRRPKIIQVQPASVREVKPSALVPVVPVPSAITATPGPSRTAVTPTKPPKPQPKVHRLRSRRSSAKTRKNGIKHRLARLWPLRRSHRQ
ncbi:MAG: TonB family protein [Bryobacterales bacterium]|nr:TonB family protein [Bryobacterales bacterium]